MCRIAGIYSVTNTGNYPLQILGNKMRDVLAYGGPDDAGEYWEEKIYLGHRRLSIIDTSNAGHQPMHYKNWIIVFNGEIYNYQNIINELKQKGYVFNTGSDTEVILKAFDCWGKLAVQHFRGMFAFALWDKQTKQLLLCRDRVGVKPLYWYHKNGIFLFASELKSFRQFDGFDTLINPKAVSLFLQTGYIKSPHSIYQFAYKVEPGSFLEIDEKGNIQTEKYWSVNNISINHSYTKASVQEVINEAEKILTESFQLRMVADVPVGVFLSGGIDSSLVTALLQKNNPQPLKTFTIGFENAKFNEAVYAKAIARYLGTNHYEYYCTEDDFTEVINLLSDMYDEPFGDSSSIPTHLVSKMARKHVTVALSADGGDEVFAGYTRYKIVANLYNKLNFIPASVKNLLSRKIANTNAFTIENFLSKTPLKAYAKGFEWKLPKLSSILKSTDLFNCYESSFSNIPYSLLQQICSVKKEDIFENDFVKEGNGLYSYLGKIDINSYLEGDILTKVDRATMSVALEGREPLLDNKVIEFGISLPDNLKIYKGQSKWILRQVLYKYVPPFLIERPKQGFGIPVKEWLQKNYSTTLNAMADDKNFADCFLLNQNYLKQIVAQFIHQPNKANINPHFMWSLFSLYKWYLRWL